jgi:hypothetical protein
LNESDSRGTNAPAAGSRRAALRRLAGVTLASGWRLGGAVAALLAASARAQDAAASAAGAADTLEVAGAPLKLEFGPGFDPPLRAATREALRTAALAVAAYFGGRFPVAGARIQLEEVEGRGVHGGRTNNEPDLNIHLRIGETTSAADFRDDWVLVHEMIHLSLPDVPRSQLWFHEGVATYVEGVARGHAGLERPLDVWHEWRAGMPKGQPAEGDRGIDHTPTWGRTYWGGAMFCLLADVRIRERSRLKSGLQQALQGLRAAGGSYAVAWPLARTLAVADAAVGQDTLAELHAQWAASAVQVDLSALWASLGVGDTFDDDAPRAAVRRAILS